MSDIRRRRSASEIGSFHIILFIGNLKRGIYQPKKWFQNWNSLHRENLPNGETFQLWRLDQEQSDEKIISAMLRESNCRMASVHEHLCSPGSCPRGAATEEPFVVPLINLVSTRRHFRPAHCHRNFAYIARFRRPVVAETLLATLQPTNLSDSVVVTANLGPQVWTLLSGTKE
jgi:hypothetical protein